MSFLSNQLVLIAPASSKARLTIGRNFPLARALGTGRLAMADPDAVPAGKYGKAALDKPGRLDFGRSARLREPKMSAPRWRWSSAARHRSALSMQPMRGLRRASASSGRFRRTAIRRSPTPSPLLEGIDQPGRRRFPPLPDFRARARRSSPGAVSRRAEAGRSWLFTVDEWEVILLSLKVSAVAVGLTLPIAFALAWLLARGRFPGKVLLDALVHLPLVLPPVVTGWLLLLAFGTNGPAGRLFADWFGLTFMFRWTGAALAAAIMALPLMVRAMRISIEAVDRRLEDAAQTLGASRLHTFASITLPLAFPGVLAGRGAGLCPLDWRVRRDDHFRLQHSRRNTDTAHCDLQRVAAPRWRCFGDPAVDYCRRRFR